jgi:hypothetical protein
LNRLDRCPKKTDHIQPSVAPEPALTDDRRRAGCAITTKSDLMIGAKPMIWSWCRRLLAACAACIDVAVVTISHSVSLAEFPAVDALMLRLMAMDNYIPSTI